MSHRFSILQAAFQCKEPDLVIGHAALGSIGRTTVCFHLQQCEGGILDWQICTDVTE